MKAAESKRVIASISLARDSMGEFYGVCVKYDGEEAIRDACWNRTYPEACASALKLMIEQLDYMKPAKEGGAR